MASTQVVAEVQEVPDISGVDFLDQIFSNISSQVNCIQDELQTASDGTTIETVRNKQTLLPIEH